MIFGYAVEKLDEHGRPFHDAYFEARQGASLRAVRDQALAWANEHRGVVSAVGLLTDQEMMQELKYMAEDGL